MGNKICFHPRVLLTDSIALNFKSSSLERDVFPIIADWRKAGADLAFTMKEFEETFSVVSDLEQQFNTFDTQRNGRIDAHEVLMVYILLSSGDIEKKVDTIFSIFDFPGGRQQAKNTINFDEATLLLYACVRSMAKVCELDFIIEEDEINFHCKSMFDMHHLNFTERISRQHFKEWVFADPSPRSFLELFHNSQGLPDIYSQVQQRNVEQGTVFQMLAKGRLTITPQALLSSPHFRRVVGNPNVDELEALVHLMDCDEHRGQISNDRYHTVLRPWNIFNECDLDGSGTLDEKEMEVLLWIQLRKKPVREFVREFLRSIDCDSDGDVSRKEWVQAIAGADRAAHNTHKSTNSNFSESEGEENEAEFVPYSPKRGSKIVNQTDTSKIERRLSSTDRLGSKDDSRMRRLSNRLSFARKASDSDDKKVLFQQVIQAA